MQPVSNALSEEEMMEEANKHGETSNERRIHALEVSPPSPSVGRSPTSSTHGETSQMTISSSSAMDRERRSSPNDNPDSKNYSTQQNTSIPILSYNSQNQERPSNTTLLCTAFVSFMTFSLVQLFFAFLAGSEAMKGDSAAMIVDSLTYLFNWYAEKRKDRFDEEFRFDSSDMVLMSMIRNDPEQAERLRIRERRKLQLKLEIIPPLISVTTLIGVTIVVMKEAVSVLALDISRKRSEQSDPDIHLMMAFSVFNLGLDFLNVFCFARARHLFGFETKERNDPRSQENSSATNGASSDTGTNASPDHNRLRKKDQRSYVQLDQGQEDGLENDFHEQNDMQVEASMSEENASSGDENENKANLNMCSAYTHVFADTLRSIAVIVAATLAELTGVTSEEADSAAAIAVSILIILSLIPLFQGLVESSYELRAIHAEERTDGITDGINVV